MAGGLVFAALFPFAPLGGLAAMVYAPAQPPLAGLTGVGRWDVHLAFSALGAALSLWVVLGPALARALAAARLAGLRSSLLGGLAIWIASFPGLSLIAGAAANGGLAWPGIGSEVVGWALVLFVPVTLGAIWTATCVAVSRRLRLRIVRRGVAPAADAP